MNPISETPPIPAKPLSQDESHLKNLAIAHYVVGSFMILISCTPLFHAGMGLLFLFDSNGMMANAEQPAPEFIGWLFLSIGLFGFLIGQAIAISTILSGRYLKKRKNYTYSFVASCIACFFMPFGTALGILTIIVLNKESVKQLYEKEKLASA